MTMVLHAMPKRLLACAAAAMLLALPCAPAFADTLPSEEGAVAKVSAPDGTTSYYAALDEAIEGAPDGSTVMLLTDASLKGTTSAGDSYIALAFGKPLTIDGDGHAVTVGGLGIYVTGAADEASAYDIVFRNITLTNSDPSGRVVSSRGGYKNLTFDDVVMMADGTGTPQAFAVGGNAPQTASIAFNACELNASPNGYGIVVSDPVDLTLADTSVSGRAALCFKGKDSSAGSSGSTVAVTEGSALSSTGTAGADEQSGTIVMQGCQNVTVTVKDSTVTARASSDEPATSQAVVLFSSRSDAQDPLAHDDTVVFDQGSAVKALGENSALVSGNGERNVVEAKGGTFELEGSVFATDDPAAAQLNVTGGQWSRDMAAYVPEGYASTGAADGRYTVAQTESRHDDPTQPATPINNADSAATVTHAATPSGSASAAKTEQVSDSAARASVQQTGDGELTFMAVASVAIIAASLILAMRRHERGRC